MKLLTLFFSVTIATSTLILAQDCTMEELAKISSIYGTAVGDSCPEMTTTTDNADYCSDEDCVNFMSDMLKELPNCTTSGINVKERVQTVVESCDTGLSISDVSSSSSLSSGSAFPTLDTTSKDRVTNDTTSSSMDGSLSSSSVSSFGFAISSIVFAAIALFTGL
ncbi:unnamed protein product [Peronospora belbahrii]|uniref:Elicitin-like protein n=1 Tax=Peronospora belbahrii TaxID=622444 RepID=A0ABN8CMQ4_9STRA|nr:unnamed protein product [Peronospora belbahrii]